MSNTGNHSASWSEADIQKYLNGELSPREMHELERAALDDPFLADALEGLAATPSHPADLQELRARLAARVEKKEKTAPILWFRRPAFRIAAAVILLAGIGLALFYPLSKPRRETSDVAKTFAVPPAPSSSTAESTLPSSATAKTAPPSSVTPNAGRKSPSAAATDTINLSDKAVASTPAIKHYPARHADKAEAPAATTTATDTFSRADIALAPPPAAQKPETIHIRGAASNPYLFSGRVVDANNRPLAGASLVLNNAPGTGTTTDDRGYFNVRVQPRDTTNQLTVALPGYKPASFALNTNEPANNVIRLEAANPALDEVVVSGFGAKRKETLAAVSISDNYRLDSAWIKVFPVIGKPAYQQYLDTAKNSLRLDPSIHGRESISFEVDQKGQLTAFRIERSLSPAHDAGLIQLITTGPAWKLLRGKKARAVVTLNF
jgi:hypothetical protein